MVGKEIGSFENVSVGNILFTPVGNGNFNSYRVTAIGQNNILAIFLDGFGEEKMISKNFPEFWFFHKIHN